MMEKGVVDCCILCKTKTIDELNYGPMYSNENIAVHLYCMLFAPGLLQNGSDNDGFDGFLFEDIKKEAKRVGPLKCKYCKNKGANLGCCKNKCPVAYHTQCAIENNLVFEFTTKYRSYCKRHKTIKQKDKKNLDSECGMCYDTLNKKYPDAILSPCCKNSWFHKKCMQKFALTSALLFKCPLCSCKDTNQWAELGIFFPIRDAAWELEANAYQELYDPIKLSCEDIKCKNKSLHAGEMYMWRLCQFCGSAGIHEHCFQGSSNDNYTCKGCDDIFKRPKNNTTDVSDESGPIKATELDQSQETSDNDDDVKEKVSENNQKPVKSSAATLFGESDVSSDDEVWKSGTPKIINMNNFQSKPRKRNAILDDSDASDNENQPPPKKVMSNRKEPAKQKSIASILLGESDASDDSDMDCTLIIL